MLIVIQFRFRFHWLSFHWLKQAQSMIVKFNYSCTGFILDDFCLFHDTTYILNWNINPFEQTTTCQHYKCTDVSTQANADMREIIKPTKIFTINSKRQKLLRDEVLKKLLLNDVNQKGQSYFSK